MITLNSSINLVLVLILSCVTLITTSDIRYCPEECKCSEDRTTELGNVLVVNCQDKKLLSIPDLTTLSKVTIPIHLNLGNNEIATVSSIDFPTGLNVYRLDLDQNSELRISDDAFANLATTLKKLTLDAVGLTFHKPLDIFNYFEVLEELSISHNNKKGYVINAVKDVEAILFKNDWPVVKTLKILRMSHCGISSLSPASLDSLLVLRELDLSNNWLTQVPSVVRQLKELRKISLFRCKIDTLEDYAFLGLPKLEVIELTTNPLKTIENYAFNSLEKCLKKLRLEICHLKQIPTEAMRDLTALEILDLSQNSFTQAPAKSFVGKYCVKELLVSAEGLQFEPFTFSGQKNCVTDLTIKQMKLKTVPREAIAVLEKLIRLSLDHNEITELPKNAFMGIKAKIISLANNPLVKIDPGAFLGLPANLDLNFRRSKVADIDFLLGYPDDAIETVNLDYTDLTCRCSMKSALNATFSVQIYGTCKKGLQVIPLSSSRLEGILNDVCKEESALNAGIARKLNISSCITILLLILGVRKIMAL